MVAGGGAARGLSTSVRGAAELCRRQIAITELSVAGLIEGDRHKLHRVEAEEQLVLATMTEPTVTSVKYQLRAA